MADERNRIGVSYDVKPHAYDPDTHPELFDGVPARRVLAFIIDLVILAIPLIVVWLFFFAIGIVTLGLGFSLFGLMPIITLIWAAFYYGTTLGGPRSATIGMRALDIEMRTWYGAPSGGGACRAVLGHDQRADAAHPVGLFLQQARALAARFPGRHGDNQQSGPRRNHAPCRAGTGYRLTTAALSGQSLLRKRFGRTVTQHSRDTPQFYLTAPSPCPYLPGKEERKVFTHLVGDRAPSLNDLLTHGGFRRSQSIAYRPACETCRACVSVRVVVDDFVPGRSMKRIQQRNADITGEMRGAVPSSEQYSVFRAYLDERHRDGGMADMTVLDYAMMVEDSHVDTRIVEYRLQQDAPTSRHGGPLVAVALTDVLSDGLSMVYSFFDPDYEQRSLGTLMILDHIARARRMGLPYVYLGYWVRGSRKMDYKSRFLPQERLMSQGWVRAEM